ncbi:Uncharacterized protein ALO80_03654 [Pseudomonas caricapapayae]|uniref:Uncharacterized protein n=1 Tax=Pseudomonas caricapapayae TaxID=46678 RepID=A0A0P9M123_9PSED|nr:hypothetical protein [Pseudomonas caricapapayae]KAA8686770.1 hypothetical protein F4W67_29160 [Pseudomonas caricapapayae]KPW61167.1 Uncharacterized protein ALO80_03654 [Pseudomonas caricapapayae]RMM06737.1 hypothetical protein ALQ84_03329 [Pseudomonas caricapapayae]RMV73309.1 hypothetical protein ALP05_00128 [Pseudomonas caricapapayae]RMV97407.1 hypothetical protein ALP01_200156 [Pseudomonas caricapapayae]
MNDSEKLLNDYRLIAETLLELKGTHIVKDPTVLNHLVELESAMCELNAMLTELQHEIAQKEAITQRARPRLYLVKRSTNNPPAIGS